MYGNKGPQTGVYGAMDAAIRCSLMRATRRLGKTWDFENKQENLSFCESDAVLV